MKKYILTLLFLLITITSFSKKLYVGTNAEFPPYEYLDENKLTGFDIELMELLGEKSGYTIVWKNMSFDGLIPALQTNKIDAIIAGMAQTPDRKKAVDFSNPYLFFDTPHLVLANSNSSFTNKKELKNKIVGVQLGSMQENFAKNLGANVRNYNSFLGALLDLKNNKIDGVIISEESGKEYVKSIENIKIIDTIQDKVPGASIAFKKGSKKTVEDINNALLQLRDSNEYNNLVKKYFPNKTVTQ